ncbi:ABC transporter ATP-binding protein [Alloalcanivorax sp. C16-2]|uniref:ABC transporter ATP-binding protein n=1 Tax=Alloalcanivorax sp. C16-2 TaxID=3390052 RepID=UPI003970AA6E
MLRQLKELYTLLSPRQRAKLLRLQVLVVLMSFAEVAGVVSIGPFMALVGDPSRMQGSGFVADLYRATGLDPRVFLFVLGIAVIVVLAVAAFISMFTIWRLSLYGVRVGAELSNRLYRHYMSQPWLFHAASSSSELTNLVIQESQRTTNNIIVPLMRMNAKLVMAIFMAIALFIYNPAVALSGVALFTLAYLILYRVVRKGLTRNGKRVSHAQRMRFKLLGEGFGGIKDTLLLGRQKLFTERFGIASERFAQGFGTTQAMSQVPRYAMELVAFASVIFLILYMLAAHDGDLGAILPALSVYALAGFKMLPAFQQAYTSMATIRGHLAAFEAIRPDLEASRDQDEAGVRDPESEGHLVPTDRIELAEVVFRYPGKSEAALRELNLVIPANRTIGLVGASGSGKSTAIDILLGLIEPEQGEVRVDGQRLTADNLRRWQNSVGFVPQSIFLSDGSIRENIAFGLPEPLIDEAKVRRAASMAHLDDLLDDLPEGLATRVGERGVQLSGGQRQRIGIARALYHDADVLILDEATSALDGITEKLIMDAIHDFSGKKTIVMIAHRLSTVKACDRVYLMEEGRVADAGTYDELVVRNDIFRKMAEHV